ncbi:hypothetical protein NQF86_02905 [Bombella sp. TMW 2.2543]|uniref:Secreted protein n=1 Tax=Bombella pluederhausensis TaxID=2967336 RepID=A0ABT3WEU2_9PROT|nr:hypothetical protein [Bombella pluederhausensis]MCX5617622.1 hypothetical protein [Bombella pluederhausensis]
MGNILILILFRAGSGFSLGRQACTVLRDLVIFISMKVPHDAFGSTPLDLIDTPMCCLIGFLHNILPTNIMALNWGGASE